MTDTDSNYKARAVAFYLPQFHPIAENDEWWEKGFTEWTNVTKAKPLFAGHEQPDLPSELGFYDLRVSETREAQANLAQEYGVEGFAYWHYWFGNGRRILDKVFHEVLESGKPDHPFCLAWANMTWSGVWHGLDSKVLIEQTYPSLEDHERHFEFLLKAFKDPRYMKVDGRPIFLIYRPDDLPDTEHVLNHWRELAKMNGLPGLYLVGVFGDPADPNRRLYDAGMASEPFTFVSSASNGRSSKESLLARAAGKLRKSIPGQEVGPRRVSYEECVKGTLAQSTYGDFEIPCALPNWDNTPRSERRGLVLTGATPEKFRPLLKKAIESVQERPPEERLVFLKSWNEWAEGNYLEPGRKWGRQYLEVVRDELRS